MLQPHGAEQAQNTPSRVTFMRFQTPKAMSSLELLGNARKTIQAYTGTWLLQQEGRSPQDCLDYSERRNKTFEREAGLGLTVINTITSPELWAYASRVKTGNDMRQRLNQGQASLHGLCTFLFVSEGQVVNARLEGVAA